MFSFQVHVNYEARDVKKSNNDTTGNVFFSKNMNLYIHINEM